MTAADTLLLYQKLGPLTAGDQGVLLTWLDGIGQQAQVIDDLCRDTPTDVGWSVIMDVTRAPAYVLPWLGQFVGVVVDPHASVAAQRALIQSEPPFARGTPAALIAIAKSFLGGAQTVTLTERVADAYHLSISVPTAQLSSASYAYLGVTYPTYAALSAAFTTYGATTGASQEIQDALQAAKPAGLILTVTFT